MTPSLQQSIESIYTAFQDIPRPAHIEGCPCSIDEKGISILLSGHKKASKGYAWSNTQGNQENITAVLEVPPVTSPKTAVQVSLLTA